MSMVANCNGQVRDMSLSKLFCPNFLHMYVNFLNSVAKCGCRGGVSVLFVHFSGPNGGAG